MKKEVQILTYRASDFTATSLFGGEVWFVNLKTLTVMLLNDVRSKVRFSEVKLHWQIWESCKRDELAQLSLKSQFKKISYREG